MNKPWYKSKTVWGSLLIGGGMILTRSGQFLLGEMELGPAFMGVVTGFSIILVAVGLRDAISKG